MMRSLRTLPNLNLPGPLARLRRTPFWAQALAVCAVCATVGIAFLDDYGVARDELAFRKSLADLADYALGVSEEPPIAHDRYHGVAIGMPLLLPEDDARRIATAVGDGVAIGMPLMLLERALGLQDSRRIYLMRHLITHLLFITGGFACGMLAYRMLGNRWIALLAMLMFMLHPRLYVHSFINNKDVNFAAVMVIALYLTHRAFRRDTLGAFLLCGIGVGLAINVRVFGLMLLPMILAMRALDFWQAGRAERKRVIASVGIFAAAALGTVYIIHPYYWENPLRFVEGFRVLSQHPFIVRNLFMGEIYRSNTVPWNYIPVWFGITAPPVALALGALGAAAVCWQGISRPIATLRDREIRFGIMLLGCVVSPVAVVIALQANIYHGWRHMYFLWAPFCLLAAVGLHTITNIYVGGGIWKVGARLPGWVHCDGRLRMARRALAYGVACFGLITTLTAMAALHPYEYVYFNALADTKTPDALAKRYSMDYWRLAYRQSLEYLLARYPDDALRVSPKWEGTLIMLPQEDRDRIILSDRHAADFYLADLFIMREYLTDRPLTKNDREKKIYIHPRIDMLGAPDQRLIHTIRAYGSAIAGVFAKDVAAYRAAYNDAYADIAANGDLLARADFDIYAYDGALYYISADCPPPAPSRANSRIFLHITPVDPADLPAASREHGFENRDFWLDNHTTVLFFDGKCIHRQPLPDYPIAGIRTGQFVSGVERLLWGADINLAARAAAQAVYESIAAGDYGAPVAQSDFDVYLRGNALAYLKERCVEDDTDARFFLHIFPADPTDMPADSRELGFANLDFQFADHGARIADKCVAMRELPGYAIERIRTGQFVSGEGRVWGAEFAAGR